MATLMRLNITTHAVKYRACGKLREASMQLVALVVPDCGARAVLIDVLCAGKNTRALHLDLHLERLKQVLGSRELLTYKYR